MTSPSIPAVPHRAASTRLCGVPRNCRCTRQLYGTFFNSFVDDRAADFNAGSTAERWAYAFAVPPRTALTETRAHPKARQNSLSPAAPARTGTDRTEAPGSATKTWPDSVLHWRLSWACGLPMRTETGSTSGCRWLAPARGGYGIAPDCAWRPERHSRSAD